jgi:hypothetical protein
MQACERSEWDLRHKTAAISFRIYLELLVALSPLQAIHVTNILTLDSYVIERSTM